MWYFQQTEGVQSTTKAKRTVSWPHDPILGLAGIVLIRTMMALQISASCSYNLVACPTLNSAVCNCSFQNSSERNQMRMSTSEQHENTHVWFKDIWCSHCWTFGSVSSDSLTSEVFSKKNNQVFELPHHSVLSSHGQWLFCKILTSQLNLSPRKKTKLVQHFFFRQDRRWFYGGLCRVPNPADLACPISNKAPQLANFFTSTYQFVGKYNAIWTFYQSLWQNYPIYDNFLRFASSLNNSPRIWYSRPINLSEKAIPVWGRGWDPLK